jgi:DHA1 family inner membrane transport protein
MTTAAGLPGRALFVIALLCFATFVTNTSATSLAPFLVAIATEFQVDLVAAGLLMSVSSVAWAATSMYGGAVSDRVGRGPLLLLGCVLLIISSVGMAFAPNYAILAVSRLFAGAGGGAFMGTVFAAASDAVRDDQKGRAMGWIVTGQSLAMVLGLPVITWIGAMVGWRGAMITQGSLVLLLVIGLAFALPRRRDGRDVQTRRSIPLMRLMTRRVMVLLGASTMERLCFASAVTYLASYLIASYDAPLDLVALILGLVAAGNLVGNTIGAHLADRISAKMPVAAGSLLVTAVLAIFLLATTPGLVVSTLLGIAYSFVNAVARPTFLAVISEVSPDARGALMGLNMSFSSFGWLSASAIGGMLITMFGFGGLGVLAAFGGVAGALLALASTRMEPDLELAGGGTPRPAVSAS